MKERYGSVYMKQLHVCSKLKFYFVSEKENKLKKKIESGKRANHCNTHQCEALKHFETFTYFILVSLAVFGVIIILVLSEVIYYARTELKFDYEVDTQMDG